MMSRRRGEGWLRPRREGARGPAPQRARACVSGAMKGARFGYVSLGAMTSGAWLDRPRNGMCDRLTDDGTPEIPILSLYCGAVGLGAGAPSDPSPHRDFLRQAAPRRRRLSMGRAVRPRGHGGGATHRDEENVLRAQAPGVVFEVDGHEVGKVLVEGLRRGPGVGEAGGG